MGCIVGLNRMIKESLIVKMTFGKGSTAPGGSGRSCVWGGKGMKQVKHWRFLGQ